MQIINLYDNFLIIGTLCYLITFILVIFVEIFVYYKHTIIGAILFLITNTMAKISKWLWLIGMILGIIKFFLIFI